MRAGGVLSAKAYGPDGNVQHVDQIHVANVVAQRAVQTGPTAVQIHGTAQGADGQPLPVEQIEARLISSTKDPFHLNGRRTVRAPGEGTISYDKTNNPTGEKWTATFAGLDAHDVALALEVDATVQWNGVNPASLPDLTIYEVTDFNNPPGPAVGFCSTPLEPVDTVAPSTPANVTATNPAGTTNVEVTWDASTDDWGVFGYHVVKDGTVVAKLGADARSFTDK